MAERLKVHVMDSYAHGDEKDLAKEVLGQPESTLMVQASRHPVETRAPLPHRQPGRCAQKHSPEERFDLIWVLVRQPGEEPQFRFVVVPQMLLVG